MGGITEDLVFAHIIGRCCHLSCQDHQIAHGDELRSAMGAFQVLLSLIADSNSGGSDYRERPAQVSNDRMGDVDIKQHCTRVNLVLHY